VRRSRRSAVGVAVAIGIGVGVAACAPPAAQPVGRAPAPTTSVVSAGAAPIASAGAPARPHAEPLDLTVEIWPVNDPASASTPRVLVRERIGASLAVRELHIAGPRAPVDVSAQDGEGDVPVRVGPAGGDAWRVVLARAPVGYLHVSYVVDAAVRDDGLALDQHAMRAQGERLLLLPDARDDRPLKAHFQFVLRLSAMERAASSFGSGLDQDAQATVAHLRAAAFLTGPVYSATFDAYEGRDEVAWVGYSAFDPRWIAAEIATTRSAAGEYFGEKSPGVFRMLISAESRAAAASGPIEVVARTRGALVLADMNAPWSIRARMAVTSALVRRWLGGAVPFDPAIEAGLVRFAARDVLWKTGTMTPLELADEVNGLAAVVATSKLRGEPARELVRRGDGAKTVAEGDGATARALLVARVALWSVRADAKVRQASSGKRSLRDVVLGVMGARPWLGSTTGPATGARVDLVAWRRAIEAEIGAAEAKALDDALDGTKLDVPDAALGKCFARATVRFEELELGFDEAASRSAGELRAVAGSGPAARAGLRQGEKLLALRYDAARPSEPARVTVERAGREETIAYKPLGRVASGPGFKRVDGVPDAQCR
jgi:hypothetical protein